MLQTFGLTRRFGSFTAVDGLDIAIAPGTILGFVGPNGAGKTSTIRMLTGESRPTAGSVTYEGQPIDADPIGYRRRIGIVSAEPFAYDYLTGREFLHFVADIRNLPPAEAEAVIDENIDRFELADRIDSLVGTWSTGMRRKLAIIAALMHRPTLLFLDEPTNGLDPVAVVRFRDLLLALRSAGTAIFLTTHILEVVERIADTIMVVRSGRIVAQGRLADLRTRFGRPDDAAVCDLETILMATESQSTRNDP